MMHLSYTYKFIVIEWFVRLCCNAQLHHPGLPLLLHDARAVEERIFIRVVIVIRAPIALFPTTRL